ncbi:hypothetical protein CALCODRAFT_483891 [Calocera cornea HHB12733]|uniref:Uncharacterized protein n=1 Tax=Calocera cornea HHB12733 TaxID=1353952 RepID=A0A165FC56_9BASI|nr:hypothetical protein CALCODRAFT_483891 [Calocera cornea HHB12733]
MRVAALGLVNEPVLAALRSPAAAAAASPFSIPLLMQTLGPALLRPSPPDLFSQPLAPRLTLAELVDSSDPAGLVECMSLLYALLQVDTQNRMRPSLHLSHAMRRRRSGTRMAYCGSKRFLKGAGESI